MRSNGCVRSCGARPHPRRDEPTRFRFRPVRVAAWAAVFLAAAGGWGECPAFGQEAPAASPGGAGSIHGQLFTAQDPDSIAAGARVTLVYRNGDGALDRIEAVSDAQGRYAFSGLDTDTRLAYVVRVRYLDRDFLSAPIEFPEGTTDQEFDFLVSADAAPLPPDGELPPDHPPISDATGFGRPVRQDPLAMLGIVAFLIALFAWPILVLRDRDRAREAARSGPAQSLIRDIAGLDVRFADGLIDEPEYRAVRESLFLRLRALGGRDAGSGKAG